MTRTRPAHILLIEDKRMHIELTLDAFHERRQNNEVHVAPGSQEGLDYPLGHDEFSDRDKFPLLDLKMPVVDGHEVLQQIKQFPILKRIPVIVLSSSKEEGERALTYDNGANSHLVKPVSFDGFLDVVHQIDTYWLSLNVPPPL